MEFTELDEKYQKVWQKAAVLLKQGRPDDFTHAKEVVKYIMEYSKNHELDLDVFIPTAIMHDIGHSAILPEDFRFITGPEKLVNGKLAHMLIGAKIARDILNSVHYDTQKTKEIVDIIRTHDADQLKGVDIEKFYSTPNKKLFHDIDCLDRYTKTRIEESKAMFPDRKVMIDLLTKALDSFFYPEFHAIAEERMKELV
jgi:hypothetical protein